MNKISFTIPNQTTNINVTNVNTNTNTNVINVKPKIINNITDYIKLAPNVYIFCKGITL
jgi:hypothetical protein